MDIYYRILRLIFKIFHIVTSQDCRVYGNLNVAPGAKIIAGNHPNATDGFFLLFVFKEQLHFFVQDDLFEIPLIGWLFKKSGQIRVVPDQKKVAMDQAIQYLGQDKVVAIFPEARLNPDGQPMKSQTGAIRLAMMTHTPIIPIGFYVPPENLSYMKRMKKGSVSQGHWQKGGHCYLHIGSPWLLEQEPDGCAEQVDRHRLTEMLMVKVNEQAQLAMQKYSEETGLSANLASFEH